MSFDVLLVDDHKIMRDGIKAILSRGDEFRVVGEAENGPDAVQFVKRLRPDLVLMDIGLPGLNGVETTAEILRFHPECKIVILSMYDDENSVVGAIRSGARAFILKKASDTDLLEALRMVARGGAYLSPQVSDRLLSRIQKGDLEAHRRPPRWKSFAARTAGAAHGGRGQNQQGDRRHAGSARADRAQLSQDDDEEAGREQRRRPDATGVFDRA